MAEIEGRGEGNRAAAFEDALYGPWLDVARTADFVGVQTYTRTLVGVEGALPYPEGTPLTDMGYEYRPEALEATIRMAARRIGKPIIVTENGIATNDDARRIAFIDAALAGVARCRADGIDVRGYIHWSLLDNFEWFFGYKMRFGLVSVDRQTFKRTPKPSASTTDISSARFGATGFCGTWGGSITWILILSASASAAVEIRIDSRRASSSS
jgi:beta-glucosidase